MSNKGLAKAAGILMIAMFLSRILGFVREQVMTGKFGQTYITDAYFAAFTVPDLLYNLLVGGALSAAFIPVFSGYLAQEQEEEGWRVASTVINLSIILLAIGIIFGMLFTPVLMKLVAYKFSGETLELAIYLTRIMFPAVLFTGLNGLMAGILNSYKHFTAPAIGAVFYNISIIFFGYVLSTYYGLGIVGFSVGVIVGVIGNFLIQMPIVKKQGFRYQMVLDWRHPGVKKIGLLMLPAMLGLAANQINLIINQNLASGLDEGSITALRLANRLMMLPIGVFAFSISAAVFPNLTEYFAKKEMTQFKLTFTRGLGSVFFISLPAAVGLMALAEPIIRLLFQQYAFTEADTALTATTLFYYSIGLVGHAGTILTVRAFYAISDTWTPVKISAITILANYLLNLALIGPMGAGGLALAFSITGLLSNLALLIMLQRKIGSMSGKKMAISFSKSLFVSLLMGAGVYFTAYLVGQFVDLQLKWGQIIQVLAGVGIGGIIFLAIAHIFKVEEADMVMGILKRRFGRRAKALG